MSAPECPGPVDAYGWDAQMSLELVYPDSLDASWSPDQIQAAWEPGFSQLSGDILQPIQQQTGLTADVMSIIANAEQSAAQAHAEAQNMRDVLGTLKDILSREAVEEDVTPSDPEDVVAMLQNLIARKSGQLSRFRQNKKLCGKLQLRCEALEEELSRLRSWTFYKPSPAAHSDVPLCKPPTVKKPNFDRPLMAKASKYSMPPTSLAKAKALKCNVPCTPSKRPARAARNSDHDRDEDELLLKPRSKLTIRIPPLRPPLTPRSHRKTIITAIPEEGDVVMNEDPEDAPTSKSVLSRTTSPEPARFMGGKGKTTYTIPRTPLFEPTSSEIGSPVSGGEGGRVDP